MALIEKESARLWFGIGIGAGTALAVPWVLPVVAAIGRPLLKVLVSQSLVATERAREGLARLGEALSDVVAEVKAEAAERADAERQAITRSMGGVAAGEGGARGEPN